MSESKLPEGFSDEFYATVKDSKEFTRLTNVMSKNAEKKINGKNFFFLRDISALNSAIKKHKEPDTDIIFNLIEQVAGDDLDSLATLCNEDMEIMSEMFTYALKGLDTPTKK